MDVQKLVAILEPLSNAAWWRVLVRQSTELAKLQNDALAWHGEAYKATRAGDCPGRWQEFADESARHAEKYRSLVNASWSIYWNAAREIRGHYPELLGALPVADGVVVDDINPNDAARAILGIIGRLLSQSPVVPIVEKRISIIEGGIKIDDDIIPLKPKQVALMKRLTDAGGEYVSLTSEEFRSRDVEGLPAQVQSVIEAQPGAGTRIHPQWLD